MPATACRARDGSISKSVDLSGQLMEMLKQCRLSLPVATSPCRPIRGALTLALLLLLDSAAALPVQARKSPFAGDWISRQYTNGKEFLLKLKQSDHDLIGWEGKLPPNTDNLPPDLKGTISGRIADIEVHHRRGYQAHACLRLQGKKLVWQLLECDSRSSRYFPLASTLSRREEEPSVGPVQIGSAGNSRELPLWDFLSRAESFDSANEADPAAASPYFVAFRSLITSDLKQDDPSLQSLFKSGNPSARLWAAAMLWELSQADGLTAFKSLAADNAAVKYKSGSEVISTTVSEIARSFIDTGGFRDFPSKKYKQD
jgi:hypothetical protein